MDNMCKTLHKAPSTWCVLLGVSKLLLTMVTVEMGLTAHLASCPIPPSMCLIQTQAPGCTYTLVNPPISRCAPKRIQPTFIEHLLYSTHCSRSWYHR